MTAPVLTDDMIHRLIEKGLAPSSALRPDSGLAVPNFMPLPAPWSLPSRLFRHPIEISSPSPSHPRHIGLRHRRLSDHPFVRQVQRIAGIELDPDGAPNSHGYSSQRTARSWHAVDLVSAGCWRELLETAEFTTAADIAGAVAYGLDYSGDRRKPQRGHITAAEARQMLHAIGAEEPTERARLLLALFTPAPVKPDGHSTSWPINDGRELDHAERAWLRVFGIEEGWFAYDRAGFLGWTQAGRGRFAAGDTGRHRATQGDTGRHRATQGDTGRHRATPGRSPRRAARSLLCSNAEMRPQAGVMRSGGLRPPRLLLFKHRKSGMGVPTLSRIGGSLNYFRNRHPHCPWHGRYAVDDGLSRPVVTTERDC